MADGFNLAEAVVVIKQDRKAFDAGQSQLKKDLEGFKPNFSGLESAFKKVFLGLSAIAALSIKGFADAEEQGERLRASLQASFDQANESAKNLVGTIGSLKGKTVAVNAQANLQGGGIATVPDQTVNVHLKVTGKQDVEATLAELNKFASEIQQLTVYDDDAINDVMADALNLGVAIKDVEGVTKTGIGLAARYFGGDLAKGVEAASLAYNGNFRALQKIIPGLKDAASAQEKWSMVVRQGSTGFGQAEAATNTFNGAAKQLWGQLGNIAEAIGGILAPNVKAATRYLTDLSVIVQGMSPAQQQTIVMWGKVTAGVAAFVAFGPKVISTITGITKAFWAMLTPLVANPWVLAIAGVAALAVGFAYAQGKGDGFINRTVDGFERIGAGIADMFSSWGKFTAGMYSLWTGTITGLSNAWTAFKSYMGSTWTDLKRAVGEVVNYWSGLFGSFFKWVSGLFNLIPDVVTTAFSTVGTFFGTLFSYIGDLATTLVGGLASMFGGLVKTIGGAFADFGSVFASIADTMFGSFRGFVQGLITLWHQSGYMMLNVWTDLKASILNLWDAIKYGIQVRFYQLTSFFADFGVNVASVFKTLVTYIGNLWDSMIDAIANKLASVKVKAQADTDIRAKYDGKTLTDRDADLLAMPQVAVKQSAAVKTAEGEADAQGLTGAARTEAIQARVQELMAGVADEIKANFRAMYSGKQLTEDQLNSMIAAETKTRLDQLAENRRKANEQADKEYNDRQKAIQAELRARQAGIRDWATKGQDDAGKAYDNSTGANNAAAAKDKAATEQARQEQLKNDLDKLAKLPKLSDQVGKAYEMIRQGLGIDKIQAFIQSIKDQAAKIKDDAKKDVSGMKKPGMNPNAAFANAGSGGKSLEDVFKNNLNRRMLSGVLINQEEQRQKNEAAAQKKEEAAARRAAMAERKKNNKNIADNTKAVQDNTKAMQNGNGAVLN